jgi:EF hand
MHRPNRMTRLALAAFCVAPLAVAAQSAPGGSTAGSTAAADGDRVVIRVQPIDPVTFERQRREALFRSLDNDTDGRISMNEAKVNRQFVDAFSRLDRDGNGGVDRQEFERVQLEDGTNPARAAR